MATVVDTLMKDPKNDKEKEVKLVEKLTEIDKIWLKNSYLINVNDLSSSAQPNAYWSNAYLKFTDTSLGGNFGINTRYGFTPSADVPIAGRLSGREEYDSMSESMNFGMGRRYSEMFDDNEQILYLEMGDPKFNSLISYITHAIDYGTSVVANTGRSLFAFYAGKAVGTVIGVIALFTVFPFWGAALFLAAKGVAMLVSLFDTNFSYYRLEPAMHKYWRMVNILTSQIGVELGFLTQESLPSEKEDPTGKTKTDLQIGMPMRLTSEFADEFRKIIPGLLTDRNYFDVFAVANKTQVIANNVKTMERKYYNSPNAKTFTYADKIAKQESMTFASYIDELFKTYGESGKIFDDATPAVTDNEGEVAKKPDETAKTPETKTEEPSKSEPKRGVNVDGTVNISDKEKKEKESWSSNFFKYLDSSARHGANFATFRVEYIGAVSETWTNSTTEVPIKDTINNVSKKSRQLMFSMSGGNIVGDAQAALLNGVKDFAMGALDGITFGLSNVVTALMGGGYYDVPKMWDDSSFEYQRHTFKIRLGGPYGHPIAQLQDLYIPLFMLIAAAAPQAAGKAGYTTPMLCSPFIKGILNTPLAIIDSLTVERGVGNMGFDKRGRPLAIEVSFSITDLTSFITSPVDGGLFAPITSALDDASPMTRYIQLLAGRDLYTSKYVMPRAKLKWNKLKQGASMMTDASQVGTMMGSALGGTVFGALVEGFSLPIQQRN